MNGHACELKFRTKFQVEKSRHNFSSDFFVKSYQLFKLAHGRSLIAHTAERVGDRDKVDSTNLVEREIS